VASAPAPATLTTQSGARAASPQSAPRDTQAAAPLRADSAGQRPVRSDSVRRAALRSGATLQRTPDGEAVATLASPSLVVLGARDREWIKVSLEGWVRQADLQGNVAPLPAITAAMLREQPDRYVGQSVDWRLQFLARQQADELRPEMPLGHQYLLTRGPLPETGFVYLLVTRAQADQLQGLKPLDEIAATVTVRAARTRYLATPVVELVRVLGGK
jgi:hypothetical protein